MASPDDLDFNIDILKKYGITGGFLGAISQMNEAEAQQFGRKIEQELHTLQ